LPSVVSVSARLQPVLDRARARGRRPLIGVALSGGGARGLAHIGVLEGLRSLGIPVDRIAGTSMGAVIGGLYAAGYPPSEIRRIATSLDWHVLFSDRASWSSLSPLQKDRQGRALFEFGLEHGRLGGSGGLIAGQRLTTLFATLTLPVAGRESFDRLPVPFVCSATDLATGEEVVLRSGALPEAMRASMAIPLVFTPVDIDGARLVDGGLSNNLPVDRARELGADVVIGVDISTPLLPPERLSSMLGIAQQLMGYQTGASRDRTAPLADILLVPDLGAHENADFDFAVDLIERGRMAVGAAAEALRPLAESCRLPAPPGAASGEQDLLQGSVEGPVIDQVEIDGGSRMRPQSLKRWVHVPTGRPLDPRALSQQVEAIYATGYFESVHPAIEPLPGGGHLLRLRLEEKRAIQVGLGLRYEDERGPAMLLSAGRINLLGRDNAAHVDARVGTVSRLDFHYLQPSYPSTAFFTSLRLSGVDDFRYVYALDRHRNLYVDRRAVADLAAGNTLRALGEVSLAYRLERVNFRPEDDRQEGPVESEFERLGMLSLRSRVDTLNDGSFPTRGRKVSLVVDAARDGLGSREDFSRGRLEYEGFHKVGPGTGHLGVRLGTAFGGDLPESEKFLLGGPETLSGLKRAELRGNEMAALRVGWMLPLGSLRLFGGRKYYLGAALDVGNAVDERRDLDQESTIGFGLQFAADTPVGPLRLTGGWAEEGLTTLYFSVGFPF
jgi:NTE family protein